MTWFICHLGLNKARYLQRLAEGALFYTWSGEPLLTIDAVKSAMKRDGQVVSK